MISPKVFFSFRSLHRVSRTLAKKKKRKKLRLKVGLAQTFLFLFWFLSSFPILAALIIYRERRKERCLREKRVLGPGDKGGGKSFRGGKGRPMKEKKRKDF